MQSYRLHQLRYLYSMPVERIVAYFNENGGRGSRKGYVWVIAAVRLGLVYFFYNTSSRRRLLLKCGDNLTDIQHLAEYTISIRIIAIHCQVFFADDHTGKILFVRRIDYGADIFFGYR